MDAAAKMEVLGADSTRTRNDREIEEMLSDPTPGAVEAVRRLDGDFLILGVSGKMGVTLAAMTRRALDAAGRTGTRVIGVARFREPSVRATLESFGIETVTCNLSDYEAVMRLPDAANVQYLAGQKFGTASAPEETWIQNTVVPSHVARRFRDSRIVVFSTGCVYPLSPTKGPGANEDSPLGFLGEYATTCIGRERVFSHYSRELGTPVLLFRLNYSVELRYGVLVDIGQRVLAGEPVSLRAAVVNVIWQQDACARAIQSLLLAESPPRILNVTGAETIEVRTIAEKFAAAFGRAPLFTGKPEPTAWHIDSSRSIRLFGPPTVTLDSMVDRVAGHLTAGGRLLGKPTHFEVRDGGF